jgi:hypothetical protein
MLVRRMRDHAHHGIRFFSFWEKSERRAVIAGLPFRLDGERENDMAVESITVQL